VSAPLAPGSEAAPGYQVLEHLNRGLDLDVYDVWSEERDCRCVVKAVRPDAAGREAVARRLRREGRLLRRLTHPHLVRAYEVVEAGGLPLVVLETLDGATVAWLSREAPRPLRASDLAHLGVQLCSAAHYLHGHGILHLDLKPANVVSDLGRAKVLDLSLARRPGRVPAGLGTPAYLSPEQARGERVDAAADVWGIGATLWAAATGTPPFPGSASRRFEQLERRAEPVGRRRRLPAALATAIDACLEPDPLQRPAVAELAARLDPLAG
jgi:serine/threonine protein kinase